MVIVVVLVGSLLAALVGVAAGTVVASVTGIDVWPSGMAVVMALSAAKVLYDEWRRSR